MRANQTPWQQWNWDQWNWTGNSAKPNTQSNSSKAQTQIQAHSILPVLAWLVSRHGKFDYVSVSNDITQICCVDRIYWAWFTWLDSWWFDLSIFTFIVSELNGNCWAFLLLALEWHKCVRWQKCHIYNSLGLCHCGWKGLVTQTLFTHVVPNLY